MSNKKTKSLFDKSCPVGTTSTGIINGKTSGAINLNNIRYKWAYNLWEVMLNNSWFPKEVDMTKDVSQYKNLLPSEKHMYDKALSQLIFMDGLQTNNIPDNINSFITAPEVNMVLVRQAFEEALHCYDEETEILTSNGFIPFNELTDSIKVANYKEDGTIYFDYPTEIINKPHNGPMISFKSENYDLLVTANHRMIKKDLHGKVSTEFAAEMSLEDCFLPVAGDKKDGELKKLSNLENLMIICHAFSDVSEVNGDEIKIKIKDESIRKEVIDAVNNAGETFFVNKKEITLNLKNYKENLKWINIESISSSWIVYFFSLLNFWKLRSEKFTENDESLNMILSLASLSKVNVEVDNHMTFNHKDFTDSSEIKRETIQYDGVVYCVTVPSSYVVVRRNNKVSVSGNSQSYAVMIDSISANSDEIYEAWRSDKNLSNKNKHILDVYSDLAGSDDDDIESKIYQIVANKCLEGIYFYSGFAAIYALARIGKMPGSAQMIRFIQRDELTHLTLFANMFKSVKREFPEVLTERVVENIYKMVDKAVSEEKIWGKYITKGGILGLNDDIMEALVHYLGNVVLNNMGFEDRYPGGHKSNPIEWYNDFSKIDGIKTNFFEGNNASYSKGSVSMDDF